MSKNTIAVVATERVTVDASKPAVRETVEIYVGGGQKITVDKELHRKEFLRSAGIGVML